MRTKDEIKEYSRKWFAELISDPEKKAARYMKAKIRRDNNPVPTNYQKTKEWRENNYQKYLYGNIKTRSKRLGILFDLDLEDIVIPTHCPYLGTPITFLQGCGNVDTNPSIDRIDNTKGYIKGNVEVVSMLANRMKLKASKEQLLTFARNILSRYDS